MKLRFNYLIFFLFSILIVSCKDAETPKKIVFMDSFRVFEEFEMKKDYDKKIEEELGEQKKQLIQMENELKTESDAKKLLLKQTEFNKFRQIFDQKFNEISGKYTNAVNLELNKHIKKYGIDKKLDLILGTDGQGNVMYIDTNSNITVDLIKYINQEYKK